MTDQTPDPIEVSVDRVIAYAVCNDVKVSELGEKVGPAVRRALTAAGLELRPVVDDDTRAEVGEWIDMLRANASIGSTVVTVDFQHELADALATYVLGAPWSTPTGDASAAPVGEGERQ